MYYCMYIYIYICICIYGKVNKKTPVAQLFSPHLLLGIPSSAAASLRHGLVVEAAALIVLAMASPSRPQRQKMVIYITNRWDNGD